MSTAKAIVCTALVTAIALPAGSLASASSSRTASGASSTYRDPIDDAGAAPDIAAITIVREQGATLVVTVTLATPTDLGRYDWIVIGIDTDRNQHSGGMHGSEVVVLANGEHAVLHRLGGPFTPLAGRLTRTELELRVELSDLGAQTFDFAVATLRQDADVAPDRGVFSYPLGSSERSRDSAGGRRHPPGRR